jgi:Flp pilus assembly protein TadG
MWNPQFSQRQKGHSIIELSTMALLFAVLAMFCADVGILLMGSSTNERACRDACRAAAQADNYAAALKMAQAATQAYKSSSGFISSPAVDSTSFVYQDYAGSPPPDTSPFVSVTTNTNIKVPIPVFIWAVGYGKGDSVTFRKTYNFPIVKTQLYL